LFVILLRLEEGVAGFLKMPSLEVGRAAAWLVPLRCFRGETKSLWTPEPSLRRLASGSGVDVVSEGIVVVVVEVSEDERGWLMGRSEGGSEAERGR